MLHKSCGECAVLSSSDLSFPGLRTGMAFCTFVPQCQIDCDESIVLACLSGDSGVGMANDFYIDVGVVVTYPRLIYLLHW